MKKKIFALMVKLYIVYSIICDITILLGIGYLIFG